MFPYEVISAGSWVYIFEICGQFSLQIKILKNTGNLLSDLYFQYFNFAKKESTFYFVVWILETLAKSGVSFWGKNVKTMNQSLSKQDKDHEVKANILSIISIKQGVVAKCQIILLSLL